MIDELAPVAQDLLDEVLSKNHVTVQKWEASVERGRVVRRLVAEMKGRATPTIAALHEQDKYRMLQGRPAVYWPELLRRLGLDPRAAILVDAAHSVSMNLRTNVGADFVYNNLFGTQVAISDTIALSNNTLGVANTDTETTLPWSTAQSSNAAASGTTGEWTALGLARKVATTNTHTAGSATVTLAATWTATGTATGTSKAGLFGGSTKATAQSSAATNILVLANTFTATDLVLNDQLTLTWTITI